MPRRGGAGGGQGPVMQRASERQPAEAKVPQLCREWQSSGRCAHGSQCWYCHSQEEADAVRRQRRGITPSEAARRHPAYETRMCAEWQAGHCPRGGACTFAHGSSDLHSLPSLGHHREEAPQRAAQRPRPQPAPQSLPVPLPLSPASASKVVESPPLGGRSASALEGHMLNDRREASIPGTEEYADAREGCLSVANGGSDATAASASDFSARHSASSRSAEPEVDKRGRLPALKLALGDGMDDDDSLVCPITHEARLSLHWVLREPVVAADGWTYERSAIKAWLQGHDTSPMTNDTMLNKVLIPNKSLLAVIQLISGMKNV